MIEKYKDSQPIVYKIMKNIILSNKISHSYLFETKGYSEGFDLALSFAKSLLCPFSYIDNINCKECKQCENINSNNFPEITIIKPDGVNIKKEQMMNLQEEFGRKALMGNKKIYIINGVEYFNSSSANSILKFLEEPEENIIAILVTKNINMVLDTIISRCQIMSLRVNQDVNPNSELIYKIASNIENSVSDVNNFVKDESNIIKMCEILKFIKFYEKYKSEILLFKNKYWFSTFADKKDNIWAYNVLILFYRDVINYFMNENLEIFEEKKELIAYVAEKNNLEQIYNKINMLIQANNRLVKNANVNLTFDKMIIEMEVLV